MVSLLTSMTNERLCGKCQTSFAESSDWLCLECRHRIELQWRQVMAIGDYRPPPLLKSSRPRHRIQRQMESTTAPSR